jgi:hypothetical protein
VSLFIAEQAKTALDFGLVYLDSVAENNESPEKISGTICCYVLCGRELLGKDHVLQSMKTDKFNITVDLPFNSDVGSANRGSIHLVLTICGTCG